ncbi:hypothetical protein GH714_035899 [Hevea brasiliensis]|uniref:cytokinin dehydrogenase n=1 Tax=Hevea brasiliensis TaxID=3981 RepID=A0A6A6M3C6_HEVBR|nr:hypothetical protein GH714_035899 [Hevea brasiliensis]
MGSPPSAFLKQKAIIFLRFFMIMFLCSIPEKPDLRSKQSYVNSSALSYKNSSNISSLEKLNLDGYFSFDNIEHAAKDFGNRYHFHPTAVLYPKSVSDIASTINYIFNMGSTSEITVAARGHGHSLQGQAQAHQGIVINMESLQVPEMQIHMGETPYVDVSGGQLWINVLHETLKHGLAPKSWTDYLHLTIGGHYQMPELVDRRSVMDLRSTMFTSWRLSQKIEDLLSELSYIPSTLFMSEVSYAEFLDRVHVSEIKLRAKGLWEVSHPWLNLLVPKSKVSEFALEVFGNILTDSSNGPILMYPVNKSK